MCAITAGTILLGAVGAAGVGAGLYESSQQTGIESQAMGLAATTEGKQNWYNTQLQDLIQNPSNFTNSPLFQASLTGAQKTQAASGYLGSTNETGALQSQAFQQLLAQENTLAPLTGAASAPNPTAALGTASGAASAAGQNLGGSLGMLQFLLQNQGGGAGGYGFTPQDMSWMQGGGTNPSTMTTGGGYTINTPGTY